MEYDDHTMSGAALAAHPGNFHRRFGPAIIITAAAAAAFPDWDDLPGGVHRVWGHSLCAASRQRPEVECHGYLCCDPAPDPRITLRHHTA